MVFSCLKSFIQRNPALFNAATGGTLCGLADIGAQQLEQQQQRRTKGRKETLHHHPDKSVSSSPRGKSIDLGRFITAFILGMTFGGVLYPFAYAQLDARWHGHNFKSLLTKSLVEIGTVGIFVNSVSMTCRGLVSGNPYREVAQHVAKEMPRVTANDIKVWLPYNLVAFSVIPAVIRPTTTAFMEASWQTYISLRSNDYEQRASDAAANNCQADR